MYRPSGYDGYRRYGYGTGYGSRGLGGGLFRQRLGYRDSKRPYFQNRYSRPSFYKQPGGKLGWYNRRYNFKDKYEQSVNYPLSTSGTGFGGQGYSMSINQLPTYTVRANIGDQYKIYKWKICIIPYIPAKPDSVTWRTVTAGSTEMDVTMFKGQHALSIDYNDSATVSNWGQVRSANNQIAIKSIMRPLKGIIRPKYLQLTVEGLATDGHTPKQGWLDMADPAVPHYGFKYHWQIPGYDVGATIPPIPLSCRIIHTVYYGIKNCQRSY